MQRMHVLPSLPLVSAVVAAPPRTNTGDSDVQDAGAGILGQAINTDNRPARLPGAVEPRS